MRSNLRYNILEHDISSSRAIVEVSCDGEGIKIMCPICMSVGRKCRLFDNFSLHGKMEIKCRCCKNIIEFRFL